jgi:hypothetical protein
MIPFRYAIVLKNLTKAQVAALCIHVAGKRLNMPQIFKIAFDNDLMSLIDVRVGEELNSPTWKNSYQGSLANEAKLPNSIISRFENDGLMEYDVTEYFDIDLKRIFGPNSWKDYENALNRDPEIQEEIQTKSMHVAKMDFFIKNTLDTAPVGVMFRELVMNGIEAPAPESTTENYLRRIRIMSYDHFGTPKAMIVNNGRGLDRFEMDRMMALAYSGGKEMGTEGRLNRGEGAKIAAMRFNRNGLVWQSRKGVGPVYQCGLMFNEDTDSYGRILAENGQTVWPAPEDDANPFPSGDFVRVILLGNDAKQDTVSNPYGQRDSAHTITREIWNRWYKYPSVKDGYRLIVETSDKVNNRSGKAFRRALCQHDFHQNAAAHNITIDVVTTSGDVKIEFVRAEPLSETFGKTAYSRESTGENGSRMAIVWRNEMYDVHAPAKWYLEASSFGLGPLAASVGVFIHLPDSFDAKDDRFRSTLESGGHTVVCKDFREVIFNARPEWIKKAVDKALKQKFDLSDVNQYLQELANSLRPQAPGAEDNVIDLRTKRGGSGGGDSAAKRRTGLFSTRGSGAKTGTPIVAPSVHWSTPSEEPNLKDRGAYFNRATNALFLNENYGPIKSIGNRIEGQIYPPRIQLTDEGVVELRELAKYEIYRRLGKAVGELVVRGIAKAGEQNWTEEQIDQSVGADALTINTETNRDAEIVAAIKASPQYKHIMTKVSAGQATA